MMQDFKNKTVWIIGASSGIGAALARHLHSLEAKLILSARSADKLEALKQELGGRHQVCPLDISDFSAIEKAVSSFDHVDSIIHLAAIYDPTAMADLKHETTESLVKVNLLGTFYLVEAALPFLKKQGGGQIALCGSVAGYVGLPNGQPYSATKAAVTNLAESLRAEEYKNNIDVRLISPGFVETPMTDKNDFEMPMRISADEAAKAITNGLLSQNFEIHFPKKFTMMVKFLRVLPYGLYFKIAEKIGDKKNQG